MPKPSMKFNILFFDTQKVISATDRATRRVLSRFGAFVRRTAKSSIRKRKKASLPGKPPSSHTGLLKKFIFFGYEPEKHSVIIGPVRLTKNNRGQAPSILEYGGRVTIKRDGNKKRVSIQARPFMAPAFEKEKMNLPKLWKHSVK